MIARHEAPSDNYHLARRLERVERLIEKVVLESANGIPIVVEGRRDLSSLRSLGVDGSILCLKSSRESIIETLEAIRPGKEAIILMDFDHEGDELTRRLSSELERMCVKANTVFWKQLKALLKSDIRSIEELHSYMIRQVQR